MAACCGQLVIGVRCVARTHLLALCPLTASFSAPWPDSQALPTTTSYPCVALVVRAELPHGHTRGSQWADQPGLVPLSVPHGAGVWAQGGLSHLHAEQKHQEWGRGD